jgi:hypothetical protein
MWGAPPRTNPFEAGEHLIAVVPMVGSGTIDDPKRPMFAPAMKDIATAAANGHAPMILQSHFVVADDGVSAIVEFVAPNRVRCTDPKKRKSKRRLPGLAP